MGKPRNPKPKSGSVPAATQGAGAASGQAVTATAMSDDVATSSAGLLTPYLSSNGDWSVVPAAVKQQVRAGNISGMESLFGSDLGVGQLIESVLAWFQEDGGSGLDVEWYIDATGNTKQGVQPSIKPSRFNRSLQESTCEQYKQRLLLEGQPQSVAGFLARISVRFRA